MPSTVKRDTSTSHARSSLTPPTSASASTTSTATSTRSSSPSPSTGTSTLSTSADVLLSQIRLRRWGHRLSPRQESAEPDMFTSRKYSPLPSSNGPQQRKRAGGGMSTWKRWSLLCVALLILVGLGWTRYGHKSYDEEVWDAEDAYTPQLDDSPSAVDETDYTSPPFRPLDSDIARPQSHDDDDDGMMHALPIEPTEPTDGKADDEIDFPGMSNPHDPLTGEAQGAAEADEDFTEIVEDTGTTSGVTSFETDVDPTSTTVCADSYPDKPIVQYALTIDAGSTGSRIHVYKFHNCGPSPQLEYETFKSVQPGLSAYARDPTAAAASLDPLLEEAYRVVPQELRKCTPVEVKATAGLRLLGAQESVAILDEVRNRLETNWDFVVGGENSVEIMDGKDEGVYAWITANYLLGKIGEGAISTETLAVMDLGGASTQIVFEPTFPADSKQSLAEGEHKYALTFGGRDFILYQHSYLGYGLMRARRSVHNLIAFTWSFGRGEIEWDELSENIEVPNPCLSKGSTRRVELDPPGRKPVNVTMHGAMGDFESCNRIVELVMAKDAICEKKPCSFNGVYQPSLLDTFPRGQLLALSYFTDRIKPLLRARASSLLTIGDLTSLAKDVCAGPTIWQTRWPNNAEALAELEDRPEYCLDLTFMNALLGLGYELGPARELMVEKKIRGVELGWALGAGLALVEKAQLTCMA